MFHGILISLEISRYLSIISLFFNFPSTARYNSKIYQLLFFLLTTLPAPNWLIHFDLKMSENYLESTLEISSELMDIFYRFFL